MENNIENYNESIFESIKHINEYGDEFWYARELQTVLGYKQWRRFYDVIERAKICLLYTSFSTCLSKQSFNAAITV